MTNISYHEYKKLQEDGSGWSYGTSWGDQMEEAILEYFSDKPKDSRILDVGCGEGRGLQALKDRGFTNLVGIDISTPKVEKARSTGLEVYEVDFHDMGGFGDFEFDYLFCSHAIEHSLEPIKVLREARRISKCGLFITPIDSKQQPPLGQSPHTHNFSSVEMWENLFGQVFKNYSYKYIRRLGDEVWSYYND